MRELRKAFFTGLLLCLPLAVTIWIVYQAINLAATPVKHFVLYGLQTAFAISDEFARSFWVEQLVLVISALIVVVALTFIGLLSRYFLGRFIIEIFEGIIERVPMIKSVYNATKQIVATFGMKNKATFKQVVLVQFPHPGCRTVAFVTNRDPGEISEALGGGPYVHVFVPTTPNPTGGYFLVLPERDVIPLKMSVADGMKLIVSGGAVLPDAKAQ